MKRMVGDFHCMSPVEKRDKERFALKMAPGLIWGTLISFSWKGRLIFSHNQGSSRKEWKDPKWYKFVNRRVSFPLPRGTRIRFSTSKEYVLGLFLEYSSRQEEKHLVVCWYSTSNHDVNTSLPKSTSPDSLATFQLTQPCESFFLHETGVVCEFAKGRILTSERREQTLHKHMSHAISPVKMLFICCIFLSRIFN